MKRNKIMKPLKAYCYWARTWVQTESNTESTMSTVPDAEVYQEPHKCGLDLDVIPKITPVLFVVTEATN